MKENSISRVIFIDQSLKDESGHHFEYVSAANDAFVRKGFQTAIYAHESCHLRSSTQIQPLFHETWTSKSRPDLVRGLLWCVAQILHLPFKMKFSAQSFGEDLRKIERQDGDHFFIHTLNFSQLIQAIAVIASSGVALHIVLRQNPDDGKRPWAKTLFLRFLFFAFKKSEQSSRTFFYADTKALCARYQELSGLTFSLLPILFDQAALRDLAPRTEELKVVFLGDGRAEKGFQHLPTIVQQTWQLEPTICFYLQNYLRTESEADPLLAKASQELTQLSLQRPDHLRLFHSSLSTEDYLNLLRMSDVVLIPYNPKMYRMRSSGILAQSIAAAKIAIVPEKTSLADEAPASLCRAFRFIEEIPKILVELSQNYPSQSARTTARIPFCEFHSTENFVRQILLHPGE